jgi:hypothetical protein
VSYALRLVADAQRALMALPIPVQEMVFDLLDREAAAVDPSGHDAKFVEHLMIQTDDEFVYVQIGYAVVHSDRAVVLERVLAVLTDQR